MSIFGYRCEYCAGTVRAKRLDREVFDPWRGFVILEDVVVGVCDRCHSRYDAAATLQRVDEVAMGRRAARRTEPVPVAAGS